MEHVETLAVAAEAPSAFVPERPLPPVWLMGFGWVPLGAGGAVTVITIPQLLAANHVPEPQIAGVTAVALMPGFLCFLLSPVLDWRYRRRSYAILFTIISAASLFAGLIFIRNVPLLTAMLFVSGFAAGLTISAVSGWFGNLVGAEDKAALGVWFTVGNLSVGGLLASVAIVLVRELPYALGAALLCVPVLAVLPLLFWTPCPPADRKLASESFGAFAGDVLALLKKPSVLWTLPIFLAPSASFALTNVLGGLGRDFHTSEKLVGLLGGAGATAAGVIGSLSIQALARTIKPRPLYLMVGIAGALFTAGLVLMGRTPAVFGLAMLGENVFQAAAFATTNIIILRTIGQENPLAATQFGLLNAAVSLPLAYMQAVDGSAYGSAGGPNGSFLADAAISGGACALLGLMLWAWRKRIPAI